MKTICAVICAASLFGHAVFGQDQRPIKNGVETASVGILTAYQAALARADLAVAKSLINERLLKGEIGEAIRDQTVGRFLQRSGEWQQVSPRLGRQGIDGLSMRVDADGRPTGLLVEETKYGSARLSETKDGIQLGERWTNKRLLGLAKRYREIHSSLDEIELCKIPKSITSRQKITALLGNDEGITFWRNGSTDVWKCDGDAAQLAKAKIAMPWQADYLQRAGEGAILYRKRLFQVKIQDNQLIVTLKDAENVDELGSAAKLPIMKGWPKTFDLPKAQWATSEIQDAIEAELKNNFGSTEAKQLASELVQNSKTLQQALETQSYPEFAMREAAKVGLSGIAIVVPLEIAEQLSETGQVDWQRVAGVGVLAGGSAATGSTLGNATTFALMRTEAGYSASAAVAELIGLRSASRLANGTGGLVGGGATVILFAYGGYWFGYYDLQTANHSAVAGVAGVGAGAAASAATLGLISTYATAGTGVAISSLSGASATSASLAWLGGGLGVAGGTVFLNVGAGIVVIGVAAAVNYGFQVYYEHEDSVRLEKTIEYLSAKQTFFIPNAH